MDIIKSQKQYFMGKSVLDIGCCSNEEDQYNKPNRWKFGQISNYCNDLYGIDIIDSEVKKLKDKGYNVECHNAENFNLGRKFETIHACNIIEHLSNIGNFLSCCENHMKDNGVLIISTGNTFNIPDILKSIFQGRILNPITNEEHTVYLTKRNMDQLLSRYNLEISEVQYYNVTPEKTLGRIRYLLYNSLGNSFKSFVCFVIRKKIQNNDIKEVLK